MTTYAVYGMPSIVNYLRYFNEEHPCQALDSRTSDHVFYKRKSLIRAA